MFFSIQNTNNIPIDLLKVKSILFARKCIILYKTGATELQLDDYLLKEHKTNLKQCCLKLLNQAVFMKNAAQEIIVVFNTKEADKLASLITYGNSELHGSAILRNAFTYTKKR